MAVVTVVEAVVVVIEVAVVTVVVVTVVLVAVAVIVAVVIVVAPVAAAAAVIEGSLKRTSLFALLVRLLQRFGIHHLKPRLTELAGAKTLPQGELPQQHPASSSRPRFALVILTQLMDWHTRI